MNFRPATPNDADAIADLHTANWQLHYRGAMSDDYLDREAADERRRFWNERLADIRDRAQTTVVTDTEGTLLGFSCIDPDAYPDANAYYLDNLHVATSAQGKGLGKRLMQVAAARLLEQRPDKDIFLWVLTDNAAAIRFYDKLGGRRGPTKRLELAGNAVNALEMRWRLSEMAAW